MTRELSGFYHTDERITTLLAKLTNQMCLRCVAYVEAPAKLWEQPITELLARLAHAIAVEGAYRTEYGRIVREISEKCLDCLSFQLMTSLIRYARSVRNVSRPLAARR